MAAKRRRKSSGKKRRKSSYKSKRNRTVTSKSGRKYRRHPKTGKWVQVRAHRRHKPKKRR